MSSQMLKDQEQKKKQFNLSNLIVKEIVMARVFINALFVANSFIILFWLFTQESEVWERNGK